MNGEVKTILLGSWMALFMVFAARKFTQPIKVALYYSIVNRNQIYEVIVPLM